MGTIVELETYFRFLAALLFVLALLGLGSWALRRYGIGGGMAVPAGRAKRIGIVEVMPLDARRRLVLIRRDGVEHLLLLGVASELVIETAIPPGDAADTRDGHRPVGPSA